MKDYGLIRQAYSQVEKYYIRIIDEAVSHEDYEKATEFRSLSRINEYAYFVLFWGQFESFIDDKTSEIIGNDIDEMRFLARVEILVPEKHEFHSTIEQYYGWRCDLAHGNILQFPELTLPTIFDTIEDVTDAINNGDLPLGEHLTGFWNPK